MTPTDITMDIGATGLVDAIDRTRYAMAKQVPSVADELATNYGPLVLTAHEQADLRIFLDEMLLRLMWILEAQL